MDRTDDEAAPAATSRYFSRLDTVELSAGIAERDFGSHGLVSRRIVRSPAPPRESVERLLDADPLRGTSAAIHADRRPCQCFGRTAKFDHEKVRHQRLFCT